MDTYDNSTAKCVICDGEFIKRKMVEGVKCESCHTQYPHAKTKEEAQEQQKKVVEKLNKGSFEGRVKDQVEAILVEYGILQKCFCDNLFYKTSPNKKSCGHCNLSEKETE